MTYDRRKIGDTSVESANARVVWSGQSVKSNQQAHSNLNHKVELCSSLDAVVLTFFLVIVFVLLAVCSALLAVHLILYI